MKNDDSVSISRATSTSRHSRKGSTASRSQSLIKRNVAPQDLRPSDVLIERFTAWKAIVKQLIAYFEGIADIENNTARELTKLGAVIQVPFRAGNQFLGEGGLQDVFYSIRDKSRVIADHHANLGRTIDSSIVQHLQKLRSEIKAHIKNVQNDTGKLATSVAKERELSAKLIGDLATNISIFKNTPMGVTPKSDPYVVNTGVTRQLRKQVHEENALQKSIIIMQQNSAHFESGIVRAIQSAWQTYDEWQSRASSSIQNTLSGLSAQFAAMEPDKEWIGFSSRSDHLLDPETPLRDPENINYPSKEDPSVLAVHTGYMERKKRFTRTYKESYYVLTPAGYLHEYPSSDPVSSAAPSFSLFLPMCTLGPPSSTHAKSHKFHIEGKKDGSGTTKAGGWKSMSLRGRDHAWSFRSRSHEDMMEWWNDIRMLCARYLVASEALERSGPVQAAVRAVGYQSEGEDDEEDSEQEDEGSSVEEEEEGQEGEDEGELYADAREGGEEELPGYSIGEKGYGGGLETGPHGYAVDKKPGANSNGNGNVGRRPSKRQQEKAPEGRAPRSHDYADGEGTTDDEGAGPADGGPAPVESRFAEHL